MNIVSGIVVYILLWWWVFFMTLPFGAKAPDNVEKGHASSAPQQPRLLIKAGVTTIIAFVLWLGINVVITADVFSFRDIAATS
jgi:predicted secreted protein